MLYNNNSQTFGIQENPIENSIYNSDYKYFKPSAPPSTRYLLLETGNHLLLEAGNKFLLENDTP